jgi:drug/metabolite transporter (DMT)-like permease
VIIISGTLYALVAVFFFVLSSAMFRKIEKKVSPTQINAFRTTIGALTFIIMAFFYSVYANLNMYSLSLIALLIVSVIFGQIIGDTAFFYSQEKIGTTITLSISMTFPFFTFILSIVFIDAYVPFEFFIAGLLISTGVLIIAFYQKEDYGVEASAKKIQFLPVFLSFVASIGWAVSIVLMDLTFNEIGDISGDETASIVGNLIRFPFAAVILIMMAYRSPSTKVTEWESSTWSWLLLASVLGSSIAMYLYSEATRIVGASFVALISTSSPLVAIPVAWLLNGEKISKESIIGIIFILGGVLLIL